MSASRTDRSWRARRAATPVPGVPGNAPATPVTTTVLADQHVVLAGGRLEDVLAEVERSFGAAVDIVRVDRAIVGGIAGFFGREQFEVEVSLGAAAPPAPVATAGTLDPVHEAPEAGAPETGAPETGAPVAAAPAATGGAAFAAALQEALDQLEDADPQQHDEALLPAYAVVEDPPPQVHSLVTDAELAPVAPAPVPVAAPAPVPAPVVAPVAGVGSLLSLNAASMSIDELSAQVDGLAIAAPASPERGVIAVAGDGDEALVVAESLALAAGGAAGDVIVMSPVAMPGRPSWMCLNSPEQAAGRREVWRTSKRLVVVAVVVTPGAQGQEWGSAALAALEPDQTRVAVPGWRRPDEVAGRLAAMAPVHAIDLVGAADPSAVIDFLDLAVPVATIDGVPATSRRWAEMLLAAGHVEQARDDADLERPEPAQPVADQPRPGTIADDPVLTALLVAAAQEHTR